MKKGWSEEDKCEHVGNTEDEYECSEDDEQFGAVVYRVETTDENNKENGESSGEEEGFFVAVETIMGRRFTVFAFPSDTVDSFKARIAFQEGIPFKEQHLFMDEGRTSLNHPNLMLSEIGINEDTAENITIRLVTSMSSGLFMGSKDSSSPPPLPFIPSSYQMPSSSSQSNNSRMRTAGEHLSDQQSSSSIHLPPLGGLDQNQDIDGVVVYNTADDKKIVVILKKHTNQEQRIPTLSAGYSLCRRSAQSSNLFDEFVDRRRMVKELRCCRERLMQQKVENVTRERNIKMERIREDATTMQKMNKIRTSLSSNKKPSEEGITEQLRKQDPLGTRDTFLPKLIDKKLSNCEQDDTPLAENFNVSTTFLRSVTSGVASLNRLKAEIYLESKESGGGSLGILPYTQAQLCKYVQLKINLTLAEQYKGGIGIHDCSNRSELMPRLKKNSIVPTVVINRQNDGIISTRARRVAIKDTDPYSSTDLLSKFDSPVPPWEDKDTHEELRDPNHNNHAWISPIKPIHFSNEGYTRNNSGTGGKQGRIQPEILPSQSLASATANTTIICLPSTGRIRPASSSTSNQKSNSAIHKKKKDVVRCSECRKRIGVACRYQCRCGKMFCSTHRYAESHSCSYDYKTEGRKQLEEANPLIVANKVEKI